MFFVSYEIFCKYCIIFARKKYDKSANELRIVQEEEGSCKLLTESFLGGTEANHVKLVSFFMDRDFKPVPLKYQTTATGN
jgi:hypothetical protein